MVKLLEFQTILNDGKVDYVRFSPRYSVVCSVGKAPFNGTVDVVYCPQDKLIELESFEKAIHSVAMDEFTVESFCAFIYDSILDKLGGVELTVDVYAETIRHAPVMAQKSKR